MEVGWQQRWWPARTAAHVWCRPKYRFPGNCQILDFALGSKRRPVQHVLLSQTFPSDHHLLAGQNSSTGDSVAHPVSETLSHGILLIKAYLMPPWWIQFNNSLRCGATSTCDGNFVSIFVLRVKIEWHCTGWTAFAILAMFICHHYNQIRVRRSTFANLTLLPYCHIALFNSITKLPHCTI